MRRYRNFKNRKADGLSIPWNIEIKIYFPPPPQAQPQQAKSNISSSNSNSSGNSTNSQISIMASPFLHSYNILTAY